MTKFVKKTYQVKGKLIERDVPDFDWEAFKNLPNAEAFVRLCYFAAVKRIVREIAEGKNQTTEAHLSSTAAVLVRSTFYTKQEVREWFDSRDWTQCAFKDAATILPKLKKEIENLAVQKESGFSPSTREKLQNRISKVADKPSDDIADHIFSKLDLKPGPDLLLEL